ncbi:MAG: LuxR C-terminal-related transcriptional regulator, partial [Umezawaea sp.]
SLLVELAMAERGLDRAASVRHISNAVPLLRSVRERAAAVVRIAPTVLVAAPEPVHDLIASVAAELGAASDLTGVDRELAYRLEARVRFSCHADPAGLGESIRRLTQMASDGMVGTGAGRELLIVLLDAATLTAGVPSAEVARLAKLVLEREPASPTHVHTAIPLLVTALSSADAVEPLVPWLDLALERALLQNVTIERALIRSEQALALVHLGQVEDARTAAVDALDLAALDWKGSNATAAVGIAAVAMELGDPRLISQLLGLYHERTESTGVTPVYRLLHASEAAVRGDHATALEYVLECGHALDRMGWSNPVLFPWRPSAALLNHRLGKLDLALEFAEEARRRAVEWGAPSGIGRALRILGHLTPEQRGVDLLRESVEVLCHSGNGFQLAKSLVDLGGRLLVDGDSSAPVYLRRARDLASQLGARRLVTKVDLALQASPRGDLAPPVPAMLTKSERRVAELVVAGHANQEIADILNVTCRTVEKHLTNSFRKLGIRGRTELPEALVRI